MATSTVKWFNAKKGYGFIENPFGGGGDIFVHYSAIISKQQFKSLEQGVTVDFECNDTTKGLQASNVQQSTVFSPQGANPAIDDDRCGIPYL
ncbi:MAG: cold shock domain-containing protein [Chlorobiaceae bacterium]|nr:cold shock domain-containing protein [Chlorobiaceae bacterium]